MYLSAYRDDCAVLTRLGYTILLVNYTGSIGLEREALEALPGHVGDIDVKDVHHAVEQVRGGFERVGVMGGSHGGFLAAHLVGQYPGYYYAAVMRNPVIDMSTMVGSTDIPDWCHVESGIPPFTAMPPSAENLVAMQRMSPISHAHKITSPVLLQLGAKDLRVPPSQGLALHRLLRAKGVVSEVRWYPEDCHPLNKVQTAADALVNTHLWFFKHKS